MSSYADEYDSRPRRRRDDRPPYPADYADDGGSANGRRTRQPGPSGSKDNLPGPPPGAPPNTIPPPPLGSAMKRDGSRSRVPHLRPEFPDEASYLNGSAPDAERKTRRDDRGFRNKRDGYEDEEGEQLRKAKPRGKPRDPYEDDADMPPPPPRDRDRDRRRDKDPDRYGAPPPRDYDDRRGPPRRRDDYDDEDLPPRRRGPRDGVEYGADPIKPMRRRETDRPPPRDRDRDRPRRRRDDYDDPSDDDDYRPRRHRSEDAPRRRREDDYYGGQDSRDSRRRQDAYDRDRDDRRRDRSRRGGYTDDERYYDDYDRRDRRGGDRDRRREPREMKVGKYDVGPMVDQGKKYYSTLAPIVTPIVMNYLRNKK